MKSQNGVTLISVIIYIIAILIILSIIAVINTFFYSNIKSMTQQLNPITEISKFNTFITDEINRENIKILECEENYIVFDNGVQYTFVVENKGLYRNQVKICEGVELCEFTNTIANGKNVVNIKIKIGNKEQEITYSLKN